MPLTGQDDARFSVVEADTLVVDSMWMDHSPMKASMYSAVLPGLGQIYNRKYWKLPLVYGGIGGFGYAAIWNSREYNYYRDQYKYMADNDLEENEDGQSLNEVEWYKNTHLRYKNLMVILTIGFYALQIVDASVDAHLIDYDITDDLALTIDPVMLDTRMGRSPSLLAGNSAAVGLRCCFNF
jgi:hypothetical protein